MKINSRFCITHDSYFRFVTRDKEELDIQKGFKIKISLIYFWQHQKMLEDNVGVFCTFN